MTTNPDIPLMAVAGRTQRAVVVRVAGSAVSNVGSEDVINSSV